MNPAPRKGGDRGHKIVPIAFDWIEVTLPGGELTHAMVPRERYRKVAQRQFHDGEDYPLQVVETRSRASHNAYFAEVGEAFKNIPEDMAARWSSATHFRKWCLVEAGWYDEVESEWETRKDAMRYVAFMKDTIDEYATGSIHRFGNKWRVIERHAKSQAAAAMGKALFEESKRDVLAIVSNIIGVKVGDLKKHAKRSDAA